MADSKPDKPGFFSRLFGRAVDEEAKPVEPSVIENSRPDRARSRAARPRFQQCHHPSGDDRSGRHGPVARDGGATRGPGDRGRRSSAHRGASGRRGPRAPRPCRAGPTRAGAGGCAAKLVAAPLPRDETDVVLPVGERHGAVHEAQARPRDPGGAGRRAGARRSRGCHGASHHRGGLGRPLRQGNRPRGGEGHPGPRGRKGARARRRPAVGRPFEPSPT